VGCDCLTFVADRMNRDDAPALHKEPKHTCVQLSHMPQLKQSVAQRFRKRLRVILPVAQFGQAGKHRRKVIGIALFEVIQKLSHRTFSADRLVKFYAEVHCGATSLLM
jgi:hypothetical protein